MIATGLKDSGKQEESYNKWLKIWQEIKNRVYKKIEVTLLNNN